MSSAPRKPAPRLARPAARYWKGKAPKGAGEAPSDSDEEEFQQQEGEGDIQIGDQDFGEEDEDELAIRPVTKPATVKPAFLAKVIVGRREESELEGMCFR